MFLVSLPLLCVVTSSPKDIPVTFSLPSSSPAVIVLQQLDTRYFRGLTGPSTWQFDFVVFKRGQKEPVASSVKTSFWCRSVSLEVPLEAGEYVVHVGPYIPRHLQRYFMKDTFQYRFVLMLRSGRVMMRATMRATASKKIIIK
jgi:hypothetical protein